MESLYPQARAFGIDMIRSGDLDPVYIALTETRWSRKFLARWCVAYWCFYHVGIASYLAEQNDLKSYWRVMRTRAGKSGPAAPRGSERRHFRGQSALKCVDALKAWKDPLAIVDAWSEARTFDEAQSKVGGQYFFGPWITFKVADMLERVFGESIDFSDCHLDMYREPIQGGALILGGRPKAPITPDALEGLVSRLEKDLRRSRLKPPGLPGRPVGLQEVETVLCKFKGHWRGHYPVGHDIRAIRRAAQGWGDAAEEFLSHMPEEVEPRWHV